MTVAIFAQAGARSIATPRVDWSAVLPPVVLIAGALVLMTASALARRRPARGVLAAFTVLVALVALVAAREQWFDVRDGGAATFVGGAVVVDGFAVFVTVVICASVALAALVADGYLRREGLEGAEFYVLSLLSAAGGVIMAAANDLIVLFLGLEVLSISLYVLAGYHVRREPSREAGMKYFVLGSFASAFFLYGIALVYGATGSTNLGEMATFLRENTVVSNGVLLAGMGLLLVGFGFKVAAVPFHMWTPDVYQGAPTPVTGFMAATAKAAGFAGLLRVFGSALSLYVEDWRPLVWGLAVLTLVVGSVLAVAQDDVKRLLAYSSIAHAGYVLVGLQAANDDGVAGALFYLLVYAFLIVGSFAVVTLVARRGDAGHAVADYQGLARRRPLLALAFTVLLLGQAGVPFTAGFFAKFYVIAAAVRAESYVLAVIAMLAAVVALYAYLRLVVAMYMSPEVPAPAPVPVVPFGVSAVLVAALGFTLFVGVLPHYVVDFARHATLLAS